MPTAEMKMKMIFLEKHLEGKFQRSITKFGLIILKKSEQIGISAYIKGLHQIENFSLVQKQYVRVKRIGLKYLAYSIIYIALCFKKVTPDLRQ